MDRLPQFNSEGLRVKRTDKSLWQIDVRLSDRTVGVNITDDGFRDDAELGHVLGVLNAAVPVTVTLQAVRALADG